MTMMVNLLVPKHHMHIQLKGLLRGVWGVQDALLVGCWPGLEQGCDLV